MKVVYKLKTVKTLSNEAKGNWKFQGMKVRV